MPPRAEVEIFYRVDLDALRTPTKSDIESGVILNRDHEPAVAMNATWELAATRLADERETVARLAAEASDEDDFENLAFEELTEFGLDLGVEAACIALCSAGCVTGTSCRGHPEHDSPWSTFPAIVFVADRERARLVLELAKEAGCGLVSTRDGELELWASSVEEVMHFAERVLERCAAFDQIPRPRAFAEAFGDEDESDESVLPGWPGADQPSPF